MADLKAYGLAISFAAAALWAVVVVFNNRASEKIVTAALPLATGALVAVFLAVYVFAVQPPILLKFPVCFIVRLPQGTPAVGLPILWSGRFVDPFGKETAFRDEHPELFQNRGLASLYNHLLQRHVIDWMTMYYRASWRIQILSAELPGYGLVMASPDTVVPLPRATIISNQQLRAALAENKFVNLGDGPPGFRQLVLPPGTSFKVETPRTDAQLGEVSRVTLRNSFCKLTIDIATHSIASGIGGYRELIPILEDQERLSYETATYFMTVRVDFERLKGGHPEMAAYRAWAQQVANGLRDQFDEERIWSRIKADFVFHRITGAFPPPKMSERR